MSGALLQVRDLAVGYGHVGVLEDVSLDIPRGEIVALVGSNGAGKSTLLRAISGLLKPSRGGIAFDGRPIAGAAPRQVIDLGILHVAEGRRLFRTQSVRDNLLLGLYGVRADREEERARMERVLALFPMLADKLDHQASTLSGGQQQMLAIGQALMREPVLLMLDEPSLGLAPILVEQVMELIVRLNGAGTTVLLVEQMVEQALAIAHRGYVLQSGRLIAAGTPAELRAGDALRRAYTGT